MAEINNRLIEPFSYKLQTHEVGSYLRSIANKKTIVKVEKLSEFDEFLRRSEDFLTPKMSGMHVNEIIAVLGTFNRYHYKPKKAFLNNLETLITRM